MAETTDNNATYNFEDTFESNLFKITGPFVPDNIEEAQTMRFLIMKLLKACPSSVTNDIRNVVTGVRRWAKRLRGKGNDHAWSDFMVSKFQHHMEKGSNNRPKQVEMVLNNVNTTQFTTATAMAEDRRPPCCSHTNNCGNRSYHNKRQRTATYPKSVQN